MAVLFRNPGTGTLWRASGYNIALLVSWGWEQVDEETLPPGPVGDPYPQYVEVRDLQNTDHPAGQFLRDALDPIVDEAVAAAQDPYVAALVADETSQTGAALRAALGIPHRPEDHGAAALLNGAVDDTAAVQAALTAAAADGRPLLLSRVYRVTGVAVTGTVSIVGTGGMLHGDPVDTLTPRAKSGLETASGTATALTITNGPGSLLADFAVINNVSAAPTAGTGIKFSGDGSSSQTVVRGVTVLAFYDLVETSGVFFTFDHCRFYDGVRYGLFQNNTGVQYYDHGDFGVANSVFAQNYKFWACGSAFRWESGGGIRLIGNKFLGGVAVGNSSSGGGSAGGHFGYCIDIMAKDGVNTGDLTCTGNSISNFNLAGIRIGIQGTTGSFINAAIGDNLINVGYASAKAMILGAAAPGLKNQVRCLHVADNVIDNMPGGGLFAFNMKGLTVGVNTWINMPDALPVVSLGEAPDDGTGLENVSVARQNVVDSAGDLIVDKRRLNNSLGLSGVIEGHEFGQNLYSNSSVTWTTLGYFDLPVVNGGAAELEVLLTGYDFGVGPFYARYRRLLTKVGNTATVTVATDGTDTTAGTGTPPDVQFVTTTADRVIVQYRMPSGKTTSWGEGRVRARGRIERSHKGA